MHGAGNDYVFVDCFAQSTPSHAAELAQAVSDRRQGIGADGLILILPAEDADARMRMFNADGTEAQMCGNGIRCLAKYLYDHGLTRREQLKIDTARGPLTVELTQISAGKAHQARVAMGRPLLTAQGIPTTLPGDPPLNAPLTVGNAVFDVTCVSMGNPHCVLFVEDVETFDVSRVGAAIENHSAFPERVNVEFVQVLSPDKAIMRVWERGSAETAACGTGACAALAAGVLTGRMARRAKMRLPGGCLAIQWLDDGDILMTGPAVEVFSGNWPPQAELPNREQKGSSD